MDVIAGMYKLYDINNDIVTTLNNQNLLHNPELDTCYKQNGIKKNIIDFFNVEIVWVYQNICLIHGLDQLIKNYIKSKKRFLIIPIGIELSNGSHSNILIYDKHTNIMERFEPNGSDVPPNYNYNEKQLDKILYNYFINF